MVIAKDEIPLAAELKGIAGLTLKLAEPLARHTSMKIGGPADYFVEVDGIDALAKALALLRAHKVPVYLLGNGSNVLISDRGVRGAVIHLGGEFKHSEWRDEGATVLAKFGAACAVGRLARQAARKGYAGMEFSEGIPGTVGGALMMNAGAYGSEFEKIVERVEALTANGKPIAWARSELHFTYRDSNLPAGVVVTRVEMRLRKGDASQVGARLNELAGKRKSSQPAGFPNSGSMFRNPPGDYAGRLIEAVGLKGQKIGQAQIAERHANFIVNLGGAKAVEVRQLMELARSEVRRQFGIELVAEVKFVGDWGD
jgi:UDP-N-acetylmuramate dehydrogenase